MPTTDTSAPDEDAILLALTWCPSGPTRDAALGAFRALTAELDALATDLARVTAERDAAVVAYAALTGDTHIGVWGDMWSGGGIGTATDEAPE